MFGFGKKHENEVEVIRQALRDQIIRAKQEEESGLVTKGRYYSVEKLIGSPFSSGYLYAFCRHRLYPTEGIICVLMLR